MEFGNIEVKIKDFEEEIDKIDKEGDEGEISDELIVRRKVLVV